jgi:hypothetical protein
MSLDSTERIISQIGSYSQSVLLSRLAHDMGVEKGFLYARLVRMSNHVYIFASKQDPIIMLNPEGWAAFNEIKKETENPSGLA